MATFGVLLRFRGILWCVQANSAVFPRTRFARAKASVPLRYVLRQPVLPDFAMAEQILDDVERLQPRRPRHDLRHLSQEPFLVDDLDSWERTRIGGRTVGLSFGASAVTH